MSNQYKLSHFTLGSLEVFSLLNSNRANIDNYWWRDACSTQGFGPFTSLWDCMEHYKSITKGFSPGVVKPAPNMGELVRLDFVNKTRVDN